MVIASPFRCALAPVLLAFAATACSPSPDRVRDQIEREMSRDPDNAAVWDAAREHFPREYEGLIQRLVSASQTSEGRNPLTAEALGERITTEWLIGLMDDHMTDLMTAPQDDMLRVFKTQQDTLAHLKAVDTKLCAQMAMGEVIQTDSEGEAVNEYLSKMNVAMLEASAAGMKDPQQWEPVGPQEYDQMFAAMRRKGTSQRLIDIVSSDAALLSASDRDKCDIGVAINDGVASMSPQMIARFIATWHDPTLM